MTPLNNDREYYIPDDFAFPKGWVCSPLEAFLLGYRGLRRGEARGTNEGDPGRFDRFQDLPYHERADEPCSALAN
jgi:hypothetical protein